MGRAGVGRLGQGTGATALPVVPTARWAGVLGGAADTDHDARPRAVAARHGSSGAGRGGAAQGRWACLAVNGREGFQ